jgi:hypothetical protein
METPENQYQELCEEYRTVLRLFWEIPSIVIAIVSGILIGIYAWIPLQYELLKVFLLFISSLMIFVAFLSAWKHRSFGYYYVELLKARDSIPRDTKKLTQWIQNQQKQCQSKGFRRRKLLSLSVQKLFLVLLVDILAVFLFLAFYELLISVDIMPSGFAPTSILANVVVAPIGAVTVIIVDTFLYRYFD